MRLLAIVLLVMATCALTHTAPQPVQPLIARPFSPPANYAGWYESAEKCLGMKGDFKAVTWLVSPTPWGDTTYGQWWVARDSMGFVKRVEITINAPMWLDSTLIIHESMHDILWRNGWAPPPGKAKPTARDELLRMHPMPPYEQCAPVFYPWHRPWGPPIDSTYIP